MLFILFPDVFLVLRVFQLGGRTRNDIHISERIEQLIQKDDFEEISFIHKGRKKTYFMHREELTVSKCGNVVVVFSGKVKELKKVKALVTNMLHLSAVAISKHYSFRWEIEVFFKELKQYLGLGDYQVRHNRWCIIFCVWSSSDVI